MANARTKAEERQRLDDGDADEHRGPDHAGRLGLAGHRLDGLADQDAQPDARAESRQAVAENVERAFHGRSSLTTRRGPRLVFSAPRRGDGRSLAWVGVLGVGPAVSGPAPATS
jgi:hypothetical protein